MENTKEMRTWLDDLKLKHPLVIAYVVQKQKNRF